MKNILKQKKYEILTYIQNKLIVEKDLKVYIIKK